MTSKNKKIVDQNRIVDFVTSVEQKKGFARDPDKVFRHIVSELGELDAAIYKLECLENTINKVKENPKLLTTNRIYRNRALNPAAYRRMHKCLIGYELLDLLFLVSYMADLFSIDLNSLAPARMEQIRKKYGVDRTEGR